MQFVKGEHLEEFPYQYLDCPKHFHGKEKCTFRTLFWWGHHVASAWILEGSLVKQYKKHLIDRFQFDRWPGPGAVHRADALGMEARGGLYPAITHDRKAQVAAVVAERSFLKIVRIIALDDPRVQAGEFAGVSRETFLAMRPIMTA